MGALSSLKFLHSAFLLRKVQGTFRFDKIIIRAPPILRLFMFQGLGFRIFILQKLSSLGLRMLLGVEGENGLGP